MQRMPRISEKLFRSIFAGIRRSDIWPNYNRTIRTPRASPPRAVRTDAPILAEVQTFVIGEQHYRKVGERECGTKFKFLVWETECPTCSDTFSIITGTGRLMRAARRCSQCRHPGLPVAKELAQRERLAREADGERMAQELGQGSPPNRGAGRRPGTRVGVGVRK
jgi:hypothetical protein